jgi:hypothetical protein
MKDIVELHQAYVWTCDECGRDQFERGVTYSLQEVADMEPDFISMCSEMISAAEEMADPENGVDLVMGFTKGPDEVECNHCGHVYGTRETGHGDD